MTAQDVFARAFAECPLVAILRGIAPAEAEAVGDALVDAGFLKVDYVALVDAGTLEPLEEPAGEMRLIAAATIGTTRLIDNVRVISDTVSKTGSPRR